MSVLGENYNFYGRGEWVLVHVYTYQLKVVVGDSSKQRDYVICYMILGRITTIP